MSKYIYIALSITIAFLIGTTTLLYTKNEKLVENLALEKLNNELLSDNNKQLSNQLDDFKRLNSQLNEINHEYKVKAMVLNEVDKMGRVSLAKPKLVERRVNDATKKILESIACNSDINDEYGLCNNREVDNK